MNISFGFGAALLLTGGCPPVICARGRPRSLSTAVMARLQYVGGQSVSVGIKCRAYC